MEDVEYQLLEKRWGLVEHAIEELGRERGAQLAVRALESLFGRMLVPGGARGCVVSDA